MRAGGAVTLINPAGTKGWEPKCIVIESISPSSPATVSSGLHFELPQLLEGMRSASFTADAPGLNVGDPSRMQDDTVLKDAEDALPQPLVKKRSRKDALDVIDVGKRAAKCQVCKVSIPKGGLRFGWHDNYMGNLTTRCVVTARVGPWEPDRRAPNRPSPHSAHLTRDPCAPRLSVFARQVHPCGMRVRLWPQCTDARRAARHGQMGRARADSP